MLLQGAPIRMPAVLASLPSLSMTLFVLSGFDKFNGREPNGQLHNTLFSVAIISRGVTSSPSKISPQFGILTQKNPET